MSEIVILGETLDFLVWHESPGSFYVREKGGNLQVIELVRALPAGAQTWIEELTIDPDPIRISDCLLLPPPCVAPEDIPEDWQLTWIKTHHGKRLMLDDSDHEPLERALASYKAEQQFSYRRQIEEARTIQDTEERKRVMALLREKYEAPLHWIGDPGQLGGFAQPAAGILNISPEMVKAGAEVAPSGRSIRDEHLVQWWARKNGVDLDEMARQRSEHYDWLRKHVGKLGVIHNMEARNKPMVRFPSPDTSLIINMLHSNRSDDQNISQNESSDSTGVRGCYFL